VTGSQKTYFDLITNTKWLMMFKKVIAIYS
jgi:hypothetical protein